MSFLVQSFLVHIDKKSLNLSPINVFFLLQKMENKKSEIKSIIKDFREIIKTHGFKYKKAVIKNLRK